jgi:hypothetical protein
MPGGFDARPSAETVKAASRKETIGASPPPTYDAD